MEHKTPIQKNADAAPLNWLSLQVSKEGLGTAALATMSFVAGFALTMGGAAYFDVIQLPGALTAVSEVSSPLNDSNSESSVEIDPFGVTQVSIETTDMSNASLIPVSPPSDAFNPQKPVTPEFDREAVLNDFDNRIADDFSIPDGLRDRVGFWFDVYTKYDSERRLIHHARYPWIIYKVVDVNPIIFSDKPRFRWMRNEKADKLVKEEATKIRAAIRTLAKRPDKADLTEHELMVKEALLKLGPDLKKLARQADGEVRVQMGQKNFFMEGIEVSPRYLGTMEKIFEANKLPIELTRIPFVESSFNKHATSKVGASGIWQFMGYTGRKFMIVDDIIDERRSPFKATEAAARLLKENHLILYRQWPLAVTAWNHGPGGIRKASQTAGSRDLSVIVSKYRSRSFDFASSNFYCEFLGALHAERYNREIYGDIQREDKLELQVVKLPRRARINEIVRVSGMTAEEFVKLNPELRRASKTFALPAGFRLHVTENAKAGIERLFSLASADRVQKASSL